MKPVRKLLIIKLTFILILSSVNITAFATEIDRSSSNTVTVARSEIIIKNPAALYSLNGQSLNSVILNDGAFDFSDSGADAAERLQSQVVTTVDQTVTSPAVISDILSCIYLPPTILSVGQEIAEFASQYDGYKYVYGAAKPSVGFDCSGLVYYVYGQFGYTLPRTASMQYRDGATVEKSELQPGDLVFFATYGGRSVTHVGIYIGNNEFINATSTGHGVKICNLDDSYWSKAWVGAKRIINIDNLSVFA